MTKVDVSQNCTKSMDVELHLECSLRKRRKFNKIYCSSKNIGSDGFWKVVSISIF